MYGVEARERTLIEEDLAKFEAACALGRGGEAALQAAELD